MPQIQDSEIRARMSVALTDLSIASQFADRQGTQTAMSEVRSLLAEERAMKAMQLPVIPVPAPSELAAMLPALREKYQSAFLENCSNTHLVEIFFDRGYSDSFRIAAVHAMSNRIGSPSMPEAELNALSLKLNTYTTDPDPYVAACILSLGLASLWGDNLKVRTALWKLSCEVDQTIASREKKCKQEIKSEIEGLQ